MIHPRPQDTLPQPLADLQETHLAWSIWEAAGTCYASRLAPSLAPEQMRAGMVMTLHADNAESLALRLVEQGDAERAVTA